MRTNDALRHAAIGVALAGAVTLGLVAPGCGTDAVDVAACQQIESARCLWGPNCGIDLTDPLHHGAPNSNIDACIQFYQTQCLHGLSTSVTPGAVEVNACVAAIKTGNCDIVKAPQTSPECSFLNGPDGGTGCQASGTCVVFAVAQATADIGGVVAADAICQTAAAGLALTGTFKAWLSDDSGNSPNTRFTQNTVPYVSHSTGNTIADNYAGLIAGTLLNLVDSSGLVVWTGTNANGTADTGNTCSGFTSASASVSGEVGETNQTSSSWTAQSSQPCSDTTGAIMCFQQ